MHRRHNGRDCIPQRGSKGTDQHEPTVKQNIVHVSLLNTLVQKTPAMTKGIEISNMTSKTMNKGSQNRWLLEFFDLGN